MELVWDIVALAIIGHMMWKHDKEISHYARVGFGFGFGVMLLALLLIVVATVVDDAKDAYATVSEMVMSE